MRTHLPLLVLLSCLWTAAAGAVVIASGDGTGNTTPPANDPGFANVGISSDGLAGVYLGNRWVLTAAHVGERDFIFGGVTYGAVAGSRRQISKGGVQADLAMIKLAYPPPPLPDVQLASAPMAVDDVVTMIGTGWTRQPTLTCWNGAFGVVACPGGVYEGYLRLTAGTTRWGTNVVDLVDTIVPVGPTSNEAFRTTFDEAGLLHEAQIVPGDSGGGVFFERNGQWELVGIHFVMGAFQGQPNATAMFGNQSFAVDVHAYRSEIEAILLLPAGVPGLPWPAVCALAVGLVASARRPLSRSARSA